MDHHLPGSGLLSFHFVPGIVAYMGGGGLPLWW